MKNYKKNINGVKERERMSDMGWTKYESDIERDNWEACFKIATSNGHTIAEAEECSDFSVGCMDCPFRSVKA